MGDSFIALQRFMSRPRPIPHACCCMGPRDGDPVCPCAMAYVELVNGVYYQISEQKIDGQYTWVVEPLEQEGPYIPLAHEPRIDENDMVLTPARKARLKYLKEKKNAPST